MFKRSSLWKRKRKFTRKSRKENRTLRLVYTNVNEIKGYSYLELQINRMQWPRCCTLNNRIFRHAHASTHGHVHGHAHESTQRSRANAINLFSHHLISATNHTNGNLWTMFFLFGFITKPVHSFGIQPTTTKANAYSLFKRKPLMKAFPMRIWMNSSKRMSQNISWIFSIMIIYFL